MTELFDAVSQRLKTIFTAHAAMELEAEVIARHVERKATLLHQAAKLEKDDFKDLADELRQRTSGLDPRRPTEAMVPLLTQPNEAPTPHADGEAVHPTPDNPTPDACNGRNGRRRYRCAECPWDRSHVGVGGMRTDLLNAPQPHREVNRDRISPRPGRAVARGRAQECAGR